MSDFICLGIDDKNLKKKSAGWCGFDANHIYAFNVFDLIKKDLVKAVLPLYHKFVEQISYHLAHSTPLLF